MKSKLLAMAVAFLGICSIASAQQIFQVSDNIVEVGPISSVTVTADLGLSSWTIKPSVGAYINVWNDQHEPSAVNYELKAGGEYVFRMDSKFVILGNGSTGNILFQYRDPDYIEEGIRGGGVSIQSSGDIYATYEATYSTDRNAASTFINLGTAPSLNVKSSAGNLFSISAYNENASNRWLMLFNDQDTVIANLAYPPILLPGGGSQAVLNRYDLGPSGLYFSTAICAGISTTTSNYTAATASDHYVGGSYK